MPLMQESYLKARGVDKYDVVIRNIEEYLMYKHGTKAKTSIGLQTVATKLQDVARFYEAHKGLNVDYFNIRPMESTCGEYYKSEQNSEERTKIIKYLEMLRAADKRVCIN